VAKLGQLHKSDLSRVHEKFNIIARVHKRPMSHMRFISDRLHLSKLN